MVVEAQEQATVAEGMGAAAEVAETAPNDERCPGFPAGRRGSIR